MRLLFMFGPMILRQVQKYQRNKQRQGYQQDRNYPSRQQEAPRRRRQETPPPPPEPKMSEEERNFRLKEEDIMLNDDTSQAYGGNTSARDSHEMDYKDQAERRSAQSNQNIDPIPSEDEIVPSGPDKKDDDGFELKDLFFEDEDPKA